MGQYSNMIPYGPLICPLNYFRIQFGIRGNVQIHKPFPLLTGQI
jgi:hypothetical protein